MDRNKLSLLGASAFVFVAGVLWWVLDSEQNIPVDASRPATVPEISHVSERPSTLSVVSDIANRSGSELNANANRKAVPIAVDAALATILEACASIEAANAKVSYSNETPATHTVIIHIKVPSIEQSHSVHDKLASQRNRLRELGIDTTDFDLQAERILASYFSYRDSYKLLVLCAVKGNGVTNFIERYVGSENDGLLEDGLIKTPADRTHYRYSSKWEPGDWAHDRYQRLVEFDPGSLTKAEGK